MQKIGFEVQIYLQLAQAFWECRNKMLKKRHLLCVDTLLIRDSYWRESFNLFIYVFQNDHAADQAVVNPKRPHSPGHHGTPPKRCKDEGEVHDLGLS